jgi:prepilin-type processing-associated H-X9-DG protein
MARDRYDDDDDRPRRRRDEDEDDRPRSRRRRDEDDDDDRPRRRSRRDDDDFDRPPPKRGMGGGMIALIVGGIVLVVFLIVGGILVALLLPAVQKVREASARMQSQNNMKEIGLSQMNYETTTGSFSRPFLDTDERGVQITPPNDQTNRLSWRVSLLPYLMSTDGPGTYSRFNIREGWNSPTNLPLKDVPIRAYRHPLDVDDKGEPLTRYRCFYDNGALFDSKPHFRLPISGVSDGTSNTLMYVECTEAISWTAFNDFRYDPIAPLPPLGHPKTTSNGFNAMFADGSVRFVRSSASPQAVKAAITRAGGEVSFLD